MNNDESELLREAQDLAIMAAVADIATVMGAYIKVGMSPNLVLSLAEEWRKDAFVPLTKTNYELILDVVLKRLPDFDLDGLTDA